MTAGAVKVNTATPLLSVSTLSGVTVPLVEDKLILELVMALFWASLSKTSIRLGVAAGSARVSVQVVVLVTSLHANEEIVSVGLSIPVPESEEGIKEKSKDLVTVMLLLLV